MVKPSFIENDNISANNFENENVHKIYDIIYQQFSDTRYKIWDKVTEFINYVNPGSIIADIGCGNGKNMGTREDCKYIGLDICKNLINQAKKKENCKYLIGNCLYIPMETESVDYVMSIAVIHHLSTEERRLKAIEEIARILKKGGQSLIYVWAFEQPKFENELSQDVNVKWTFLKKYFNSDKDKIFNRYYHLFKKNELENLISNLEDIIIIETGFQCNNWYCIIKKI